MTPSQRAYRVRDLERVEAQLAPLLERRMLLLADLALALDPLDTEVELAAAELQEAEQRIGRWLDDQSLTDGCDPYPMRIPEEVFQDRDDARRRLRAAEIALQRRESGREIR